MKKEAAEPLLKKTFCFISNRKEQIYILKKCEFFFCFGKNLQTFAFCVSLRSFLWRSAVALFLRSITAEILPPEKLPVEKTSKRHSFLNPEKFRGKDQDFGIMEMITAAL